MTLQCHLKEGNCHLYGLSTPASKVTGQHKLRLSTDTVAIACDATARPAAIAPCGMLNFGFQTAQAGQTGYAEQPPR